ncbi:MAG: ABC transporter ATP-binding protein, partial [Prevotella sp.]
DIRVVEKAMQLTGTAALSHRMMSTLSDGERQKVMIAKALAQQTPVIYLDEPTAFLDYPSKVDMMQLLHRICREMQKTVFLSTHDVELALQIADTVWLMSRDRGIVSGTPEDLSLDGTLPDFFCQRGIAFDEHKGVFGVTYETTRRIRLFGTDGPRMAMMRKALLRGGTDAGEDAESDISIEVTPEVFVLSTPEFRKEFATVGETVKAVPHNED